MAALFPKPAGRAGWVLALALLASLTQAHDFWKQKLAAEWTQEEAEALLTRSPWTQPVLLYQPSGRLLARLSDGRKVLYQDDPRRPPR